MVRPLVRITSEASTHGPAPSCRAFLVAAAIFAQGALAAVEDSAVDSEGPGSADDAVGTSLADVLAEIRALRAEQAELRQEVLEGLARCRGASRHAGARDGEDRLLADLGEETAADGPFGGEDDAQLVADEAGGDSRELIRVDAQNTEWMKEILFGGKPWILHCQDSQTAEPARVPEIVRAASRELRSMASFGVVDCWKLMPSGKTLAHRFDFPKPPVTFAVANGDPPVVLDLDGVVKAWQFKRKVGPSLTASVERVDGPERFRKFCTTRKACLVVGFKSGPQLHGALQALQPLLDQRRGVRAVSIDTSVWKVKLDQRLTAARSKKGAGKTDRHERAELLCLARSRGSSGSRGGAFFRASGELDEKSVDEFLERCWEGRNLVEFTQSPSIMVRPPEAPRYVSPSSSGASSASSSAKAKKDGKRPAKRAASGASSKRKPSSRADVVGSRQQLEEDDEPAFVSLDEHTEDVEYLEEEESDDDAEEVEL